MAEPYEQYKADRAEASDFNMRNLELPTKFREMQVNQLDKLDSGGRLAAILTIATEPTALDTVTIGGDDYEFVATGGAVANDANIAVELTGVVATTVDNLIAAINATNEDNEHTNITLIDAVTPALANGTEKVVADDTLGAATIRVRAAAVAGGALADPDTLPSIVLGETLTDATDAWDAGNVDMAVLGGKASKAAETATLSYSVLGVVAGGKRVFSFPFTVAHFIVQVRDFNGIVKYGVADTWVISDTDVVLTLDGGGAPEIADTDTVTIQAWA